MIVRCVKAVNRFKPKKCNVWRCKKSFGNPSYFYELTGNVHIMLWMHVIYAFTFIQLYTISIKLLWRIGRTKLDYDKNQNSIWTAYEYRLLKGWLLFCFRNPTFWFENSNLVCATVIRSLDCIWTGCLDHSHLARCLIRLLGNWAYCLPLSMGCFRRQSWRDTWQ